MQASELILKGKSLFGKTVSSLGADQGKTLGVPQEVRAKGCFSIWQTNFHALTALQNERNGRERWQITETTRRRAKCDGALPEGRQGEKAKWPYTLGKLGHLTWIGHLEESRPHPHPRGYQHTPPMQTVSVGQLSELHEVDLHQGWGILESVHRSKDWGRRSSGFHHSRNGGCRQPLFILAEDNLNSSDIFFFFW